MQVLPASRQWPANLLRFHLRFRRPVPLAELDLQESLRLWDEQGRSCQDAIVDLPEGLWSPDGRWLTVLFHPARVKSGLLASQERGPALEAGLRYSLAWRGSDPFTFEAVSPERRPLDPRQWRQQWRTVRGRRTLHLHARRLLDPLAVQEFVQLVDSAGQVLSPRARAEAMVLRFADVPEAATAIRFDPRFEDPCGNRCGRAFETEPGDRDVGQQALVMPLGN